MMGNVKILALSFFLVVMLILYVGEVARNQFPPSASMDMGASSLSTIAKVSTQVPLTSTKQRFIGPVPATASPTPQPAATATRRSAPAPTATPRPRPTATAQTGPPVYSWDQAPNHIGEYATVCGPIKSATYFSRVDGSPTFINIGRNYPDPARFTALIWGRNRPNFGSAPENRYASGSLCTTGAIELYNGSAQIEVNEPGQFDR